MKIAIVDDDINMRKSLEIALKEYDEFEIKSFKSAPDALKKLDDTFDLIVTDLTMPKMDGIEFLKELNNRYEAIVITGDASVNRAIDALRMGVKDFIMKPFEIDTLVKAIKRTHKLKSILHSNLQKQEVKNNDFISTSSALDKVLKIAKKASITDASILLLGESGVGKEVFANYIHNNSIRKDKPFIAINMAAIPDNLIESELFGYEKGAFTDAQTSKEGKFEIANGGTILLDEIGEMPIHLQAKLLRVLQEKEITRLGGSKSIKVDVRILSATNVNLNDKIRDGLFREDLFFRLNTIPIIIPPLRDRKEEILPIAESILNQTSKKYNFSCKFFSEDAKEKLFNYRWYGNIRELLSVVERAVILSENNEITVEDLFLESRNRNKTINELEADLIKEILADCNFDIKESSEMLGMNISMLEHKIKKYKIELKI